MFYKIDSRRFSIREFWWCTRSPLVLIAWLTKLLHIPIQTSSDDPYVDSLQPFEVPEESLPDDVRQRFQPVAQDLAALGFHTPVYHAMVDGFHMTKIYLATYLHESGSSCGRIHCRIWSRVHPIKTVLFPMFLSAFSDGTFLVSSAGKPDMESPPSCWMNRIVGATATALWASHQQELDREQTQKSAYEIRTRDELVWVIEQHHIAVRDFHLRRGVFKPMTLEDQLRSEALTTNMAAAEAEGMQHPEVLAELSQLQTKKTGWGNAFLILAVSILVFLGTGAAKWSWKFALLLIPILLIHELGHFVAMRVFKYRDVRMFFIPLFGAAVSGRSFNVPGWKKAIVSLMGPLPGIFLGIVLGCIGLVLHRPPIMNAAVVALILNGFNLLPVLPLDGGWVFHSLLFSRHYVLDAAFRLLAAIALLAGSAWSDDVVLRYLGIFLLIGLPMSFKMAKIASELRRRDLPSASPEEDTIPPATAEAIIGELKKAFPKRVNNKAIARMTLQVYETLNARPPGWLATFALLGTQVAGAVIAILFAVVFVVAQRGDFSTLAKAAARMPTHKLACGSMNTWQGADAATTANGARNTIIATYARRADAENAFHSLPSRLSPSAGLKVFGQTLMLTLPADDSAARKQWVQELQPLAKSVFVNSTNYFVACSFLCIAPNETVAKEIEDETHEYFGAPTLYLIPPWTAQDQRAPEQRAQHRLARQTYAKLMRMASDAYREPEVTAHQKQLNQARAQGDADEVAKLQAQLRRIIQDATRRSQDKLRQEGEGKVDLALIDEYAALPKVKMG